MGALPRVKMGTTKWYTATHLSYHNSKENTIHLSWAFLLWEKKKRFIIKLI